MIAPRNDIRKGGSYYGYEITGCCIGGEAGILGKEGSEVAEEGCLSIPGLYGDVERPTNIKVTALDKKGRETTWQLSGLAARVAQHEIDHLDGVLFIDKVDPATLHWMEPPKRD